jgi:hypothetical protein
MKRIILAVMFALCIATVVGCGGGSSTSGSKPSGSK